MSFFPSDLTGAEGTDLLNSKDNPVSSSPTFPVGSEIPQASQPGSTAGNSVTSPESVTSGSQGISDPNDPSSLGQSQGTNEPHGASSVLSQGAADQQQAQTLPGTASTSLAGVIPNTALSTAAVPAVSSASTIASDLSPSSVVSPSSHPATLVPSAPSTSLPSLAPSLTTSGLLSGSRTSAVSSATLSPGLLSNSLSASTASLSRSSTSIAPLSQITKSFSTSSESSSSESAVATTDSPSESLVPVVVTSTGEDTTLFISMTSTVQYNTDASPSANLAAANSTDKTEGNILNSDNKLFPLGVVLVVVGGLIVLVALLVFSIRCLGVTRRRRRLRAAIPSFFPTLPEHDHSHYNDPDPENEKYNHIASTEYLTQPAQNQGQPAYEEYVIGSTQIHNGTVGGGDWYDPSAGAGAGAGIGAGGGHQRNGSDGSFGNDISSVPGPTGAGAAGVGAGYGDHSVQPQPAHAPSPPRAMAADPYGGAQDYIYGYGQDSGPYPTMGAAGAGHHNQYPTSDPYGGAYFPNQGQSQGYPGQRDLTPARNKSQSSNGSSYSHGSDTRLAYQDDTRMEGTSRGAGTRDKMKQRGYL
ncbi:hypothetical protein IAU59_003408 [Kwoniella sp. CBS 9459]